MPFRKLQGIQILWGPLWSFDLCFLIAAPVVSWAFGLTLLVERFHFPSSEITDGLLLLFQSFDLPHIFQTFLVPTSTLWVKDALHGKPTFLILYP